MKTSFVTPVLRGNKQPIHISAQWHHFLHVSRVRIFLRRGRDKNNHVNKLAPNGEDENFNGEVVLAVTQQKTQSQATLGTDRLEHERDHGVNMELRANSCDFSSWFFHKLRARPSATISAFMYFNFLWATYRQCLAASQVASEDL